MKYYKLDENHKPIEVPFEEYIESNAIERMTNQNIVQQDTINVNDIEYFISTVFLYFDHSFGNTDEPILWETMVFSEDPEWEHFQERYSSYDEALKRHKEILNTIKNKK